MSQALIEQWRNEDAAGAGAPPANGGKDGSGVRAMFEASADLDAPKLARGLQLAQALGLPENVVLEQPEWAERETVARAVEKHPLLAKWAEQDRQNAAFARDDAEGLLGVFEAVDGLNPQAPDPALAFEAREYTDLELTRKARNGDEGARAELQRLRDEREAERLRSALRRTPNPSLLEQIPILLREGTDQVGKSMAGAIAMLAENLQSKPGEGALKLPEWASHGLREREEARNALLRAVARHMRNSVEERERTLPAPLRADSTVGGLAQDVVRMVPQVLGQIGVTYATGGAGGMAFMGGQIAGGQYLDLTEKDVKPGRAAFAALANAGLQAPLEHVGLGRFMDIFKTSGLGKVLLKTGEAVGTEMLTEYLQEYPEAATTIWAEAEKEGRTTEESVRHFLDRLGEIHRDGLYSAAVAAPFGLLGGAGRIATDAATTREAADFARRHKALHAKVEASRTKRLSPAHMGSALEEAGLTGTAHLPASDVLRLYQEGTDIITPLGWQAQDVADAAALGQDLEAPLSRLHARLDAKTFDAVADIMRPEPGTMNAVEAAKLDDRLQADVEDVNAAFAEYQAEQNAIDAEVELWRAEVAKAVASVPNLDATIKDERLTPDAVAENYIAPLLNFAERLQEHAGLPVAETLRKLRTQGLVRDGKRLLTPDEMQEREEARAKAEAEAPFWDAVWGRLDGQSLKRDYPDAWRELSRLHGPGLFAKKGGGLAIDELADEMEGAYLLEQGGGGDALMERLKQGKKPDRTLFQPVNEGVDLDAPVAVVEVVPRFAGQNPKVLRKRFPEDVRRAVLAEFESPEGVENADTGKRVGMSATDFHEHLKFSDADAVGGLAQLEAVAALPDLMRTAKLVESYEDRKGTGSIKKMHRFQAALRIGDKDYSVKLTVKEYKDGSLELDSKTPFKIYHHRLEKEMPAGNSTALSQDDQPPQPSAGIHEYSLRALLEDVKDSEGRAFFQSAYHGSPHRFDRFSLEAIGTGEGAQAHGWGLYFAADRKASEEYRRNLGVTISLDGKTLYDGVRGQLESSTGNSQADDALLAFNGNLDEAIAELRDDADYGIPGAGDALEVLRAIKADNRLQVEERGQLFEVDIPENDVLLDEQKKFSEQPEKVRKAIKEYIAHLGGDSHLGSTLHRILDRDDTGETLYGTMAMFLSPKEASLTLNKFGVKGIAYEGGRDGRCFVVFDDAAVKVMETYYQDKVAARGYIKPTPEGRLIQLCARADLSTLLHEMGHFFLLEVDDAVRAGLADDTLQADYATLRQWLKAEDGAELTREQHEQFARGFEAYLMEGKAPSASLESAFARFKKWLTRIYKKARALNVDLTDEVRGVFDRLLATDAEVNARAVENGLVDLTARELDALGLKGPEREAVSGLMKAACDAAEARMRADRDRQRREQVRQWAAEARAEVDADPLYGAMKDARAGGLDLEAVRQDMGEDYAARLMKRLPVAFRKEGGADPAMFAAEHGFRDPADLFRAMLDAPTKAARVRAIVDAKQQAWDANFDPADYLMETDEAARQMERVGQYVARALGSQTADQRALKRVAAAKLAAMSMGQATQPGRYRMNMRRALTAERRAIVRGEWQAALEANFQARINMEFARQSLDLKRSVEKLQGQIKRFTGMNKADPDARFLVGALAQRHGLGKLDTRLASEERKNPGDVLAAWIKEAEADGCPVIMDDAFARPDLLWRDLSVEAFGELAETIRQIVTVERNRRKLLTARGKADLNEVAEEIAASVAAFREAAPVKTVEKENPALKSLKGLHAIHAKVEALCLALDGDKQGPMWEYVYRPITKAEDEQSGRLRAARDELRKLFGVFSRKELSAMRLKREYVDGVGEKLTRENMLALALNMGNETNIQRVKEGHGRMVNGTWAPWTDDRIGDVLSRLTRRDWEFVQSVWDYFETFKAESFKLQEDITGLRPQAVEARPFTVTTADGHTLTLRGGYYPITYNAEKGFLAYEREQRDLDKEFFGGNSHSAAQTRQGHLKERARRGTGEPLLLELSVVTDHVFNVIHDLSYRRAVLDVAKVIRHPKVREALTGAVGMDMVNQLKPWLMDVANERQEPMHAVHRWANWARASTSIMQMGWKVTTMLAQPLGILQTAEVLGYRDTLTGLKKVYGSGFMRQVLGYGLKKVYGNPLRLPELLEETFARSPMMADRIKSFDREIRDMTKKLMPSSGLFGWVDTVRDSAFVPIGVMQMGVDLPTWWGGFAKGLRDFQGDEAKAAEYADSVVRMSQGSGSTKDLARVQRGGPLPRLFTMFYSYFNTFYNLAARRVTSLRRDHSPAAVFQAANTALLLWFVPAVLGELMAGRGPDDDDEWDEWAGMLIMQYPFQAVVGVRDVANHVFGEYGYRITPAQAAPKALGQWFKSVNKALEEEDAGRLVKPTVEAAGYLFGLPMKQPIITVGNIWDYLTGEDPEFEVRDLFFTKPRDRR